ncbi:MAG: nitrous oxide reductase accessory protein NosL [Lewinellaceae bacterium]|nr:nitrous oxide reductase accessory protein NosL [Lewinellaceae bacterium]
MFKITKPSQILLAIGAMALLIMLKVPIWKILLSAPQYPEGLEMKIWHNTLTGDVQVISALNHYIGMRAISVEMFPEFQFLATIILIVAGICLVLAFIGRWWSALVYYLLLAMADVAALYDFYSWGYDYGHNLNPEAPIVIPGMSYQPPILGYKKLLNFEAWSLPDIGGWILMAVTFLSFAIVVYEWWRNRKQKKQPAHPKKASAAVAGMMVLMCASLLSCSTGPRPLQYGKDNCSFCKMTLMDQHYGAEIVTKKGKVYVFDDLNCMVRFEKQALVKSQDIAGRYVVDYLHNGVLIDQQTAVFVRSTVLKTPMASGVAAFAQQSDVVDTFSGKNQEILSWEQMLKDF